MRQLLVIIKDEALARKFKAIVAMKDTSMTTLINDFITSYVKRYEEEEKNNDSTK